MELKSPCAGGTPAVWHRATASLVPAAQPPSVTAVSHACIPDPLSPGSSSPTDLLSFVGLPLVKWWPSELVVDKGGNSCRNCPVPHEHCFPPSLLGGCRALSLATCRAGLPTPPSLPLQLQWRAPVLPGALHPGRCCPRGDFAHSASQEPVPRGLSSLR